MRQPHVTNTGVPLCSYEECQQYDGKRCRETGMRAGGVCEPAVLDLVAVARAAARAVDDYRGESPDGGAAIYALCQAVDAIRKP